MVQVRANGKTILATLNVVDDESIVGCDELGVSEDAFAQLEVPNGHPASVSQAEPPESIPALFRKINGERLTREDFAAIVSDIAGHRYSKIELTAFVVACNRSELDREEVYFLTEAMVASGVLMNVIGAGRNILKIRPPMPFSLGNADVLMDRLEAALTSTPVPA